MVDRTRTVRARTRDFLAATSAKSASWRSYRSSIFALKKVLVVEPLIFG